MAILLFHGSCKAWAKCLDYQINAIKYLLSYSASVPEVIAMVCEMTLQFAMDKGGTEI